MHMNASAYKGQGVRVPATGVAGCIQGYAASCGGWESNSGPQEKQYVLLTTEPSFFPAPTCRTLRNRSRSTQDNPSQTSAKFKTQKPQKTQ